jgi:hypothetical protein
MRDGAPVSYAIPVLKETVDYMPPRGSPREMERHVGQDDTILEQQ